MHIFLTDGTGYVGAAVAAAALEAGHEVVGLARSAASAERLARAGVRPVLGSLAAPDAWASAAARADAVVHAGFEYDEAGRERRDVDERATAALLEAARAGHAADGRARAFVYTSSAYLLRSGGGPPLDESADVHAPPTPPSWRFAVEARVLDAGARSGGALAAAVVRPGLVYGGFAAFGPGGSAPSLFAAARAAGAAAYPGDGAARLSFVHVRDLAALYLRVVDAGATGVFHGVDGVPLTAREAARVAAAVTGSSAGPGTSSAAPAAALLGAHTVDVMQRDVALLPARGLALGWAPATPSFRDGAAAAYAEWAALVPSAP
jgi:nucleoside-diphosphate-sugar epimerase